MLFGQANKLLFISVQIPILIRPGSMNTALFADTVVYGEWKTGQNNRAFTMALMNFPIKLGVLIRSSVLMLSLMAIGFVANETPTLRVIEGIGFIMTIGPAATYAISAVIFFFGYRIEEKDVLDMQEEIASRTADNTVKT